MRDGSVVPRMRRIVSSLTLPSATQPPGRQRRQAMSTTAASPSRMVARAGAVPNVTLVGTRTVRWTGWPLSTRPKAICATVRSCAVMVCTTSHSFAAAGPTRVQRSVQSAKDAVVCCGTAAEAAGAGAAAGACMRAACATADGESDGAARIAARVVARNCRICLGSLPEIVLSTLRTR